MYQEVVTEVIIFIFHGFLGGVLWLLVNWQWSKRSIVQHTIVSAISGYIYWLLHSEYNFPNSMMAIVTGYFSVDFIKHVFDFLGKKK